MVREGNAAGFIFIGEKFCEYEYFEVPYLRKALEEEGVPHALPGLLPRGRRGTRHPIKPE